MNKSLLDAALAVRGALSMRRLEPAKEFRSIIANAESLDALLAVKLRFPMYLLAEENEDPEFQAIAWQKLLMSIWGSTSENGGKIIKSAPVELKEKCRQAFAQGERHEKENGQGLCCPLRHGR